MSSIPSGWQDDGTTLTAPNGHKVVLGFRERVLAGWDPSNVPLEEEHGQDPLEEFYPQDDNEGTQQTFLYSVLCWNQKRDVYIMGIGNEFLGLRNQVAQLQKQAPAIDTTQVIADVQAIADAVGQAAGAAIAKAVVSIQKL